MQKSNEGKFAHSNVPPPMKLPKGKLVKIKFTPEIQEEIRRILSGEPPKTVRARYERRGITDIKLMKYAAPTRHGRLEQVRKLIGGRCTFCDKYNTYLMKYKIGNSIVIRRLCDDHIDKI